ncbi:hypothetical protein ACFLYE_00725 [Chloroflexota bacterium]
MNSFQAELVHISDTIEDVNHRLEHLYDAIETGKLDLDDVVIRIRELRSRQDKLQARRMEIESQMSDRKVELADLESITECVDNLRGLLTEGSILERRAFIRGFVKGLKVTGNEAVLNSTMPVIPDNLTMKRREFSLPYSMVGRRVQ